MKANFSASDQLFISQFWSYMSGACNPLKWGKSYGHLAFNEVRDKQGNVVRDKNGEPVLELAHFASAWLARLKFLRPGQLDNGYHNLAVEAAKRKQQGLENWPPSIDDFIALCRMPKQPVEEPEHVKHRQLADAPKQLAAPRDLEKGRRNCNRLRALIDGDPRTKAEVFAQEQRDRAKWGL